MARLLATSLTALAALAWGCVGEVGEPTALVSRATPLDASEVRDASEARDVADAGDGAAEGLLVRAACVPGALPGPSPLRRLAHAEYDRTVRDLLGTTRRPSLTFEAQLREGTLETDVSNLTVSPSQLARYLDAADALAAEATANATVLTRVVGCDPAAAMGGAECVDRFITSFATRAYRRPPTDAERAALRARFDADRAAGGGAVASGVRGVVRTALSSPLFLYRFETGDGRPDADGRVRLTPWEVATRISYLVRGTMPDAALFDAASRGALSTAADRAAQVRRLLRGADMTTPNPDAREVVRRFHAQWWGLSALDAMIDQPEGQRDATRYPEFSADLVRSMREETLRFGDALVFERGRMRDLVGADYGFVDARLARIYGLTGSFDATFRRVTLTAGRRAGLLTQASLLTLNASGAVGSPIKRGVFVLDRFLCAPPRPVPGNVNNVPPAPDATRSNRARFEAHTRDPYCASCHGRIDPVGFLFEHYDAIGRWQDLDNGASVDARGAALIDGANVEAADAVEFAARVATTDQVRDCAVQWWFRHAAGRAPVEADACALASMRAATREGDAHFEAMLVGLVSADDFVTRRPATTP
jgi:Protein of unknown function (DUF1592)/Protein of unknown function (DUF1588)/Protein of unknown function (DUF1595)/Protein of unknown function (DUF1587)/Protein of unknown function (DUF1585)